MKTKLKVLGKHPYARCIGPVVVEGRPAFAVVTAVTDKPLGHGNSPDAAWLSASRAKRRG